MKQETTNIMSIIAIGIGILALMACFGLYQTIPKETNPVTWTAITQYKDSITALENRIIELEKNKPINYDIILGRS